MSWKFALSFGLVAFFSMAFAETQVVEATIVQVKERGMVLKVGDRTPLRGRRL